MPLSRRAGAAETLTRAAAARAECEALSNCSRIWLAWPSNCCAAALVLSSAAAAANGPIHPNPAAATASAHFIVPPRWKPATEVAGGMRDCAKRDFVHSGNMPEPVYSHNRTFPTVVLEREVEFRTTGIVISVDVGDNNLAAASTGKIGGGGKLRDERDRYLALRRRLQSNGSESARQLLGKVSGREGRHVRHVNHETSNDIVREALAVEARAIALEGLTDIRSRIRAGRRMRSRLHRWAFRQLQDQIVYKAAEYGIAVVFVDPAYTSKTCSHCGSLGSRVKHRFSCDCGRRAHSDVNAARNLARLGERALSPRADVNRPNVGAAGIGCAP